MGVGQDVVEVPEQVVSGSAVGVVAEVGGTPSFLAREYEFERRPDHQRKAIFVLSEKGGVGKTTFARGWLDVARQRNRKVAAYDADGSVGQLLRFYGTREPGKSGRSRTQDPVRGVGFFDVTVQKERDQLINVMGVDADWILIDMPGGSLHELDKVLAREGDTGGRRNLVEAYNDAGWEVVICIVIDHLMTPTRAVLQSIELFGEKVKYVVVKNLAGADADEFLVFDGYTTESGVQKYGNAAKQLRRVGGQVIEMPKMLGVTYALIDVESLPFHDAMMNVGNLLRKADVLRSNRWLKQFEASLETTVIDP